MSPPSPNKAPRPLHVASAGFFAPRLRRILTLAGWRLAIGWPGPGAEIAVWGRSRSGRLARALAARTGAGLVHVEDAPLRSLHPGRAGEPPIGLLIDRRGLHFDPSTSSELEHLLSTHPLSDPALLARTEGLVDRLRAAHLSKYCATDPALDPPAPGYVLVVDQLAGDAAVTASGAGRATFAAMLAAARRDHPDAPILLRTHPETAAGLRGGHYGAADLCARTTRLAGPHSPWRLLDGARAVYTVSSQLGFEAILAGHRPRVFGAPFYAGWGLSDDHAALPRRGRRLTATQLAAAALILAPVWYDPCRDRLCSPEEAVDHLEAAARAWREDRRGYVMVGMRRWKRPHLRAMFGRHGPIAFEENPVRAAARARARGRPVMVWAGRAPPELVAACAARGAAMLRLEDGVLRSRGLGAALTPPLSLMVDDLGLPADPARESRLERRIAEAARLPPERLDRAERLVAALLAAGLTKYNVGDRPAPPSGHRPRILVAGQVADDAALRAGATGPVRDNAALLAAARAAFPGAWIVYKPHPDTEAGLRPGALPGAARDADEVLTDVSAEAALAACDRVVTLTSTLGFEALLRGIPVTCFGAPFYAGWDLTDDRAPTPSRRRARPSVAALAHAVLIAGPRYHDPVSGKPCPPEVALERLAADRPMRRALRLRVLAAAQALRSRRI